VRELRDPDGMPVSGSLIGISPVVSGDLRGEDRRFGKAGDRMLLEAWVLTFQPLLGKDVHIELNIDRIDTLQSARIDHWERIEKSSGSVAE
jgi:hypothetical protein